jgi:hypothetical protein
MLNNTMKELTPEEKESAISIPATSMYERKPNIQKAQESIPDESTYKGEEDAAAEGWLRLSMLVGGFQLADIVAAIAQCLLSLVRSDDCRNRNSRDH